MRLTFADGSTIVVPTIGDVTVNTLVDQQTGDLAHVATVNVPGVIRVERVEREAGPGERELRAVNS